MTERAPPPDDDQVLGDDTLVFLHLPKTGGTALRKSLQRAFDPAATALVYPVDDLDGAMTREQFAALSTEDLERLRLVMGHLSYGVHRRLPRPCRYATIVREPVDRIVSLYYHYRNLPGVRFLSRGHRERLRLRLRRVSLEDWVFSERRIPADNLMIRNITGARGVAFGDCTEALFEQAMEHIDRDFVALAVTEDMERSTALLESVVGRPLTAVGRENVNPKRPRLEAIDPSVLERIRELNEFDVRLYDEARRRLEAAFEGAGSRERG